MGAPANGWLTTDPTAELPPEQRVDIPQFGGPPLSFPTVESMLVQQARLFLGYKQGFLFGTNGSGDQSPDQFVASFVNFATQWASAAVGHYTVGLYIGQGIDPVARGTYWANYVISVLKRLQYGESGNSYYDIWTGAASL